MTPLTTPFPSLIKSGLIFWLAAAFCLGSPDSARAAEPPPTIEVGIATRDVTPDGPVWLAGYAARTRPSDRVDGGLRTQAIAIKSPPGDPVVLVALDNCEISRSFTAPVLKTISTRFGLGPGRVIIVSSHTHSAPVLDGPLMGMYPLSKTDRSRVTEYGSFLQDKLVEVVGAALQDLRPARLEHGVGEARFAVNRRVYQGDTMGFGENPDGPVDWQVPVLKIVGPTNELRAILFGYACHGTSIAGDDFYTVSGDYMAYARQQLETLYPGTVTAFFTGMGADSNPAPRGKLLDAKRHGLELAGAVSAVLGKPMHPVKGQVKFAYREISVPLKPSPGREQLETDRKSQDIATQHRGQAYLDQVDQGQRPAEYVPLPLGELRIGNDLTIVALGGEVVVDYAIRLKRLLASERLWLIGYAYEVPCYIPSIRILKEGGYEAESSLIYYGLYGPFQTSIEPLILNGTLELTREIRGAGE